MQAGSTNRVYYAIDAHTRNGRKITIPRFSPGGEMITQRFGFTRDFTKEWNNSVYFRLSNYFVDTKVRARPSGEKRGL